jgi:hypothetical protein
MYKNAHDWFYIGSKESTITPNVQELIYALNALNDSENLRVKNDHIVQNVDYWFRIVVQNDEDVKSAIKNVGSFQKAFEHFQKYSKKKDIQFVPAEILIRHANMMNRS